MRDARGYDVVTEASGNVVDRFNTGSDRDAVQVLVSYSLTHDGPFVLRLMPDYPHGSLERVDLARADRGDVDLLTDEPLAMTYEPTLADAPPQLSRVAFL